MGKDAMYLEIGDVWKERVLEILADHENFERFKALMDKTEVKYMLNGTTEMNSFMLDVPEDFTPDDIQFMADMILDVAKMDLDRPFISLDGKYQKSQVVINNEKEPELLGLGKTEGYASGKIFLPILDSLVKPGRMNDSFDS